MGQKPTLIVSYKSGALLMLVLSLPPGVTERSLRGIREQDREDAIQEAWLAFAEGRRPRSAIITFRNREERHRDRYKTGLMDTIAQNEDKGEARIRAVDDVRRGRTEEQA